MIECRVIGSLEVTVDGEEAPADLLWRKNIGLAIYLARSPNGTRTRDHLVGLLWADNPDEAARHSLREALRVLRRCAGKDAVKTGATSVRLDPGALTLDLNQLEELHERGDWQTAARLIRGEMLEGFSVPDASNFENWITSERLACRNRSVEVLVCAAEEAIERSDLAAAINWSTRAHKLELGSDAAVQVAMKSLALTGNRSAALNQFETFRAYLEELGVDPQPDSLALAQRVRQGRQWRRPVRARAEVSPETRRAPLIGRTSELATAMECWNGCRAHSRAAVILVEGDPGTGKTRLAEEFVERARLDGGVIVTVRAVEADLDEPWSGVLGMVDGGLLAGSGVSAADPKTVATLASMSEQWADRFPRSRLDGEPIHLGRCLRDALRAVALEEPVVLLVDDAHWLDTASLRELHSVLQKLGDLPLLVWTNSSTGHRRDEIDQIRQRVGSGTPGGVIELGPLTSDALRTLCKWAMPGFDDERVDRLARRIEVDSGGLPLLAVELLHAVASGLELSDEQTSWPQPLRTLDQTMPNDLPDAVVGAIRVGFRRQSQDAQQILRVAAVAGRRATHEQLQRGSGLAGAALDAALDEVEWDRWLTADVRGYTFVARIVRDVILRDMVMEGQRVRIAQMLKGAGRNAGSRASPGDASS